MGNCNAPSTTTSLEVNLSTLVDDHNASPKRSTSFHHHNANTPPNSANSSNQKRYDDTITPLEQKLDNYYTDRPKQIKQRSYVRKDLPLHYLLESIERNKPVGVKQDGNIALSSRRFDDMDHDDPNQSHWSALSQHLETLPEQKRIEIVEKGLSISRSSNSNNDDTNTSSKSRGNSTITTYYTAPIHHQNYNNIATATNAAEDNNDGYENYYLKHYNNSADGSISSLSQSSSSSSASLLDLACARQPPVEIVQQLIEIAPHLITKPGNHGNTPLHTAISNQASDEVLQLLIQKGAADEIYENFRGDTPLQTAIQQQQQTATSIALSESSKSKPCSEDIIKLLVKKGGRDAVRHCNYNGETVLHQALFLTPTLSATKSARSRSRSKSRSRANNDKPPYSEPNTNKNKKPSSLLSKSVIELLLDVGGDDLTVVKESQYGLTPLDIAKEKCDAYSSLAAEPPSSPSSSVIPSLSSLSSSSKSTSTSRNNDVVSVIKAYNEEIYKLLSERSPWTTRPWTADGLKLRVPGEITNVEDVIDLGSDQDYKGSTQHGWGPEMWGLTLDQMEYILQHPLLINITKAEEERKERRKYRPFISRSKSNDSSHSNSKNMEQQYPSLRTIVNEIIIPLTAGSDMGYALFVNREKPLRAKVVVSHSWDIPFDEFLGAIRTSGDPGPFWITAFSQHQNSDPNMGITINDQTGPNLEYSSFSTVLKEAKFMMTITTSFNVYSRLWCIYEILLSLKFGKEVKLCPYSNVTQRTVSSSNIALVDDVVLNQANLEVDSERARCGNAVNDIPSDDELKIGVQIIGLEDGFSTADRLVEAIRALYLINAPLPKRDKSPSNNQQIQRMRLMYTKAIEVILDRTGIKMPSFQSVMDNYLMALPEKDRARKRLRFEQGSLGKLNEMHEKWRASVAKKLSALLKDAV